MPNIYANVDADALKVDAEDCILSFGSAFHPDIITHAKDGYIYTSDGHRMLDWTSGQMSCLVGHGNPDIVETITQHASNLDHLFSGMLSPPVINLAKRLTSLTPPGLDKAFFLSTGGESNEAAIKLAKSYTGKFEIVGLSASWHGVTGVAASAQYLSGRTGHGPMMPGSLMLPAPNTYRSIFRHADGSYDWQTELDYGFSLIDRQSCGSLAALIVEVILSSGGMLVLPDGWLAAAKRHCEARGMLLIIDEAQTGIGRVGDMFAFEHDGVVPDILTLSKTLGNGVPLAAVVTSNDIARVTKERGFLFYTTHVNDPMPAAVGLKVLDIVVRDDLVANSRRLGARLQVGLRRLQERYGCFGDVRGRGLMAGVEIVSNRETKQGDAALGFRISSKMAELGVWAQLSSLPAFGGILRIAPPINITEEQMDHGLAVMEEALRVTSATMPLYDVSSEAEVLSRL
ncbi:putative dialkylglycine decarboxylase [Diplodia seriata]|uniref:Putative dialkylglycine decarboxylase n=1 Tax=Diplodia seriata TaxID=420778 RepID=A0A0G2EJ83_9PEZI|nr:putative dialkylglycine decarboxylase [Diplodia seriata]